MRERGLDLRVHAKFRELLDVDIERIEKQPAVRRIGTAIAGTIVEQGMQRIEADAVGPQVMRQFDQAAQVGEIPHPPIAGRAHAVELDGQQPAATEITVKRPFRRDQQRHFLSGRSGVRQLQPVDTKRQTLRPQDDPIAGFAFRDNFVATQDFPTQRETGSFRQFGPRRTAGADDDRVADEPP